MDKISITYDNLTMSTGDVAKAILDNQGDCTGLNICIACPFFNECFGNIRDKARFLNKEVRLRKAEDYLFTAALEQEIGE